MFGAKRAKYETTGYEYFDMRLSSVFVAVNVSTCGCPRILSLFWWRKWRRTDQHVCWQFRCKNAHIVIKMCRSSPPSHCCGLRRSVQIISSRTSLILKLFISGNGQCNTSTGFSWTHRQLKGNTCKIYVTHILIYMWHINIQHMWKLWIYFHDWVRIQ